MQKYLRSICLLAKYPKGVRICEIVHSQILRHGATAPAAGQDSCCNLFVLVHHKSACGIRTSRVPDSNCHRQSIFVCSSPGILPIHRSSCSQRTKLVMSVSINEINSILKCLFDKPRPIKDGAGKKSSVNVVEWIVFEVPIIFYVVDIELRIRRHAGDQRVRTIACILDVGAYSY